LKKTRYNILFTGFVVGNIGELLQTTITRNEEFRLLNQKLTLDGGREVPTEANENWFALGQTSGLITLQRSIDRDSLCVEEEQCIVRLKVCSNFAVADLYHLFEFALMVTDPM